MVNNNTTSTYRERAERLWNAYGRIRGNRVYLAGEYIGRIGVDDLGQPFTYAKGDRAIGYVGIQPVALVARSIF